DKELAVTRKLINHYEELIVHYEEGFNILSKFNKSTKNPFIRDIMPLYWASALMR
ncbi:MAG: hypothetical protein ACI9IT_001892, partial [Glaciecola sp.]